MVDWQNVLVPEITSGKKVLNAAHDNTIRGSISVDEITGLNIPTGVPLVYKLDENLKAIAHPNAIGPLAGRYVDNQADIRNRICG